MKLKLLTTVILAGAFGCRTGDSNSTVKDATSQPDAPDHNCQVVMTSAVWGANSSGQMGWTFHVAVPLATLQTGYDVSLKYSLQGEDWQTVAASPDHADSTWSYFVAHLVPPGGGGASMYLNVIAYLNENNHAHLYDHNWEVGGDHSISLNHNNNWTANPLPNQCNVPDLPAVTTSPLHVSCATNDNADGSNYQIFLNSTDGITFSGALKKNGPGNLAEQVATYTNVQFVGASGYRNYTAAGLNVQITPAAAPGNGGYVGSVTAASAQLHGRSAVCD